MREGGLLDGEERADLVAARADDTDDCGGHQNRHIARDDKHHAGAQHQQCAEDQGALPAKAIRRGGKPERDARIARESQRKEQTYLRFGQADLDKIKRQNDGKESVTEKTNDTRGEKDNDIVIRLHDLI